MALVVGLAGVARGQCPDVENLGGLNPTGILVSGSAHDDEVTSTATIASADVTAVRFLAGGPASNPPCVMDVDADGDVDSSDRDALQSAVKIGRPDLLVRPDCQ